MLFDEEEIQMANTCMKLILSKPGFVNLISDTNIEKMFILFENEEVDASVKIILAETLLSLSNMISCRKQFLKSKRYSVLVNQCLNLLEYSDSTSKQAQISIICLKIVINVCSLSGTRVYIPGESHIASQFRQRSFDFGAYVTLV